MTRLILRTSIVFVVLAVLSSCAAYYPTPPRPTAFDNRDLPGFTMVASRFYRFSQPTRTQLRWLHDSYGVTDVFKLDHWYEGEDEPVPGVTVHYVALDVLSSTVADFERVYAAIDKAYNEGKTVGIHCLLGQDRTGSEAFAFEVRHGVPIDVAYYHLMRLGFHPYDRVWAFVKHVAGWQ